MTQKYHRLMVHDMQVNTFFIITSCIFSYVFLVVLSSQSTLHCVFRNIIIILYLLYAYYFLTRMIKNKHRNIYISVAILQLHNHIC